jgi:RNA methyltransferase, TrmH family
MTALRLRGVITSRDNAKLRLLRRLQSRAQRHRLCMFACEGEDLVDAAAAAGLDPVERLVAGEDVEPALLAEVSSLGHPPRVVAVYRTGDLPPFEPRPVGLALWHLGDPGNLGTLLRSADAFGAFVALSRGCADPTGPKALRASAGAIFRVPLGRFDDAPGRRVALAAHGGRPLAELDLGGPTTFVLGAERAGLPADVLATCDEIATIPTPGPAESLNVAAAGAIALYVRSTRVRKGD